MSGDDTVCEPANCGERAQSSKEQSDVEELPKKPVRRSTVGRNEGWSLGGVCLNDSQQLCVDGFASAEFLLALPVFIL